jgi:hypothetical protein
MKAIKVTKKNIDTVASSFGRDAPDEDFVEGDYVITDFGNDHSFEIISQASLDANFFVTGVKLQNDWFEIEPL